MLEPISVNYHLVKECNYECRFCFATFRDVRGRLTLSQKLELLQALRESGCQKINFAGGEPNLDRDLPALLRESRKQGFTTSIISNGYGIEALLDSSADDLDWIGLSVDSADEEVQARLGRGRGDHVERCSELAPLIVDAGIKLKINTVVTRLTWEEDMRPLIYTLHPHRWKVFQVLPVRGQNDRRVTPLLISAAQFQAFVERHKLAPPLTPVVEDNEAMTGSYAMIDPLGRFFNNIDGVHTYSRPILEVGVATALAESRFSRTRFVRRGGVYSW